MQEAYQRIPLSQLRESPTNPRRHYDQAALNELAASIRHQGVIQAALVRPHPDEPEAYEIVFGARRFRGSQLAEQADLPAVIRDLSDEQVIAMQAIENVQREDVHPLDEATSYNRLLALGHPVTDIALKTGKSESYIYQRIKLAALIDKAQEAFLSDKINTAQAIELARLPQAAQDEVLGVILEGTQYGDPLTLNGLREHITQHYFLDLHRAPFKKNDATLNPEAGPCTHCQKRTGFVPALFPDIKKKDTCTDRECFTKKIAALIERHQVALAVGDKRPPLLSVYYGPSATQKVYPEALTHNQWAEASKKCKHMVNGITVDGHEAGTITPCCIEPSCSTHRAKMDKTPEAGSTKPARKTQTPQQLAAAQRTRAIFAAHERAIVVAVGKTRVLDVPDLKTVAVALFTEMWGNHTKELFKARGWQPGKEKYGHNYVAAAEKQIDKMNAAELAGLILECCLRGRSMNGMGGEDADRFRLTVKRHGIDLAKLEKSSLEEIKEKDSAKAKAKAERDKKKAGRKK